MKIGLSSCFFHADPQRAIFKGKTLVYAELSMCQWILSQGVLAYLIPPPGTQGTTLKELVSELDALVLQGGSDIAPESYGETALRPEWKGDAIRDQYERLLLQEFMNQNKPVLGICRGAQLINVAFGGTMVQDIGTQLPQSLVHRDWEIYDQCFHSVKIEAGSRLSKLYGNALQGKINSIHHQAIGKLGRGLQVEATCPDDKIIEAVRLSDPQRFVFGVQWHPEFHDPKDASLLSATPILKDFLNEARARQS